MRLLSLGLCKSMCTLFVLYNSAFAIIRHSMLGGMWKEGRLMVDRLGKCDGRWGADLSAKSPMRSRVKLQCHWFPSSFKCELNDKAISRLITYRFYFSLNGLLSFIRKLQMWKKESFLIPLINGFTGDMKTYFRAIWFMFRFVAHSV